MGVWGVVQTEEEFQIHPPLSPAPAFRAHCSAVSLRECQPGAGRWCWAGVGQVGMGKDLVRISIGQQTHP